ncbi:MAG TPA: hypothetical protein VFQ88_15785 [Nevskiaceae bacterium]|nr:hypothetical protein [Nevskiaceae bacterium]
MTPTVVALPHRFDLWALPALITGLVWLCGFDGVGGFIFAVIPGTALLATGTGLLMWPGSPKITQIMALGGALGIVLAIPELFITGLAYGIALIVLSALSAVCAGRAALRHAPRPAEAPAAPRGLKAAAKAALDEALMGYFVGTAQLPDGAKAQALCERCERLEELLKSAAWADPALFNAAPPAPDDAVTQPMHAGHVAGLQLSFTSGYTPPQGLPGVPAWLRDSADARAQARVYHASGSGRPWLIGIHGYRMGADWLDTSMIPPRLFAEHLGYNLVLPVLPLHGVRKAGWRSGDYYLDGEMTDFLFAQAQALWDLRRTVAWIRSQEADAHIGVLGYSLGGFNAALLAAHEPSLDFVVAGIPLTEPAALLWSVLPQPHRDYFASQGIDPPRFAKLLKLVSPLALPPKLPRERLAIFAGTGDRIVPPDQPLRLSKHWDVPVRWYDGGHLTFRGEHVVMDSVRELAAAAGWAAAGSAA